MPFFHLTNTLQYGEYVFEVADVVHGQLQLDEPEVTGAVLQLAATGGALAFLAACALNPPQARGNP